MSLITRCPACGTMFNVVSDQLKVSQGWVRCGQCAVVFDASLCLQAERTPQTELLVIKAVASVASASVAVDPTFSAVATAAPDGSVAAPALTDSPRLADTEDASFFAASSKWPDTPDSSYADEVSAALKESSPALVADLTPDFSAPLPLPVPSAQTPDATPADELKTGFDARDATPEEPPADVSFVRDARRQAFWRKPLVRVLLALLGLGLLAVLLLQWAVQQRSMLAVFEPRLKPVLQAVCEVVGCTVGPVRYIEAIVIDSSTFNKVNDSVYRLSFSIKSTALMPVAMPALEVTLTDTQDQALIRRVLTPAQFGMASGLLDAKGEFSGAVTLQLSPVEGGSATSKRIAGYRLLAFYP